MNWKKLTALLLALTMIFALPAAAAPAAADETLALEINAKGAIIAETTTGQILFEYHADDKLYPASTTKLLTALVAWENCSPGDVITVSQSAVDGLVEQGSGVFLKAGEQVEFTELMRYLLVHSGNDAALALAEHIGGGNVATFAQMMNEKAAALGCKGTNFVNPTGLHDENHYTTARDLYLIAKAVMDVPELREMVGTAQFKLAPTNMHPKETTITNTNLLLSRLKDARYYYQNATGIKTGTTTPAGFCLVGGARNGDLEYISVVLGASKDASTGDIGCYTETLKLFNYAKQNFSLQVLAAKNSPVQEVPVRFAAGKERTILVPAQDYERLLPKNVNMDELKYMVTTDAMVDAPVKKGDKLGTATLSIGDTDYGKIELVASEDIERSDVLFALFKVQEFFKSSVFKIVLAALFALLVLLILLTAVRKRNHKRRRRASRSKYGNKR